MFLFAVELKGKYDTCNKHLKLTDCQMVDCWKLNDDVSERR